MLSVDKKGTLGEDADCAEDGRFRGARRKAKSTILDSLFNFSYVSNPINEEERLALWTCLKGFGTA